MSKNLLIEAIRRYNPSANEQFLIDFDDTALQQYLTHLRYVKRPRAEKAMWIRTAETPAIMMRDCSQAA